MDTDPDKQSDFEKAGSEKRSGIVGEFWAMLLENKKYWLLPIMFVLLLLGLLVALGGSAAAPFIYTLF